MERNYFSMLLLSAAMVFASCSDNNENGNGLEGGTASLKISIKGQSATRYVGGSTTNPAVESKVSNFTVFVFNSASGDLETSKKFEVTDANYTRTIDGLSTGTKKRIVAFVNVPTTLDLGFVSTYSQLNANLITLDSQNAANLDEVGLFMSGETDGVSLTSATTTTITIPVTRKVAKVILTSLIIDADPAKLTNFKLTGVSVQRARICGVPIGAYIPPTTTDVNENYAGGIASPAGATPSFDVTQSYLLEAIALPDNYQPGQNVIATEAEERYFYVMPNNGANGYSTLLTLSGTNGSTTENVYYPFVINGDASQADTDGNFIESNKKYALSVTIKNPDKPSEDPNVVPSDGTLEVVISPQDWETQINQNVEW